MYPLDLTDFAIAVPDHELADLRHKLSNTRRPRPWPEQAWAAVRSIDVIHAPGDPMPTVDAGVTPAPARASSRSQDSHGERIATLMTKSQMPDRK